MSIGRIELDATVAANSGADVPNDAVDESLLSFLTAVLGSDIVVTRITDAWRWVFEIEDDEDEYKARSLIAQLSSLTRLDGAKTVPASESVVDAWYHLALLLILMGRFSLTVDVAIQDQKPLELLVGGSFQETVVLGDVTVYPYKSATSCVVLESEDGERHIYRADDCSDVGKFDWVAMEFAYHSAGNLDVAPEDMAIQMTQSGINIVSEYALVASLCLDRRFSIMPTAKKALH